MLQEIHEQPEAVRSCLAHYLDCHWHPSHASLSPFKLGLPLELLINLEQIHIVACGTSRHAGLAAQHWFEQIAGISTRLRSAAEFVEAPLPLTGNTLTIAITQSGETADTLDAVRTERDRDCKPRSSLQSHLLGVTNQSNSTLTTLTDYTLLTLAGTEIGVAATKTFVNQLLVLYCLALELAYRRGTLTPESLQQKRTELQAIPTQIAAVLTQQDTVAALARTLAAAQHCIVLGRGIQRAIALEGALKLKETTYIHAEGYAASEFMHGPLALLDPQIPVIAIVPNNSSDDPMLTYVEKVKASGAPVIGITMTTESTAALEYFDHHISLPWVAPELAPLLTMIPLQLLAYYMAAQRGLDVDRPRHITKTLAS